VDQLPIQEILRIAQDHGAVDVRIFGSRARGDALADSDLDLLIKAQPGTSLWDLIGLSQALEDLLGIKVEAVTENELHPYLKDRILAEAKPLKP